MNYAIAGGNSAVVGGVTYPAVFYIDNCGGQVYVNTPAAIAFASTPAFYLLVAVTYADATLAPPPPPGLATITVQVVRVPQPPALPANQTLTLPENSPPGFLVAGLIAVGAITSPVTWSIVTDNGAGGRFVINATTGRLSVAPGNRLPLNYEAPPNVFRIEVAVSLSANPAAFVTGLVTLALTDVNDPPSFNGLVYTVNDTDFLGGYNFPAMVVTPTNAAGAFLDEDTK